MSGKFSQKAATLARFAGVLSVLFLVTAAFADDGPNIVVNCNSGQSLNRILSKLNKQVATTVVVKGTCTEYVTIDGFEGLTLRGQPGAAIQQPSTAPPPVNPTYVLSITGSRGVTVSGIAVHSLPSVFATIAIGKGSNQIMIQNVNTDGSSGVVVYEECQVWLLNVNVNLTSGFAAIWAFDKSDVHIVGGLLQRPSNGAFNAGIDVFSGHVTMEGTTIRDMQQAITISGSGSVDMNTFYPGASSADVIIDNPSGTNFNGVTVSDASSLNLGGGMRLVINNAGQPWAGTTGAVFVTNGSTLNAGSSLVVSSSQGQGVIVTNNSHASLGGSSVTGGFHGGLVVANLSTIDLGFNTSNLVSGNGTDLFCDSNSFITGTAYLTGFSTVNCANLVSGNTVPLP